jgi:hypothetical protein
MAEHTIGTRAEWEAARGALLEREKELTRGELPPIAIQNARATGTDVVSYLAEGFGFTTFARRGEVSHHPIG